MKSRAEHLVEKAERDRQAALDSILGQLRYERWCLAKASRPSGSGWEAVPGGHKGGFRRRKGAGFEYWYPGGAGEQHKAGEAEKVAPKRYWVEGKEHGLFDTQKAYRAGTEYVPARKELHDKIVEHFVKDVPSVPHDKKPVAIMMMGGAASGKTTLAKAIVGAEGMKDHVMVNSDDVKEGSFPDGNPFLPEFHKALHLGTTEDGQAISAIDGAFLVHEESADIADRIQAEAQKRRQSMIIDGTGKTAHKFVAKVKELQDAGYHVRVIMPHIDMETAVDRVQKRADKTGRFVPLEVVREGHRRIPGNFPEIARAADEFALFASERPPRPIWSGGKGQPDKVHDQGYLDHFLKRGKELQAEHEKITSEKAAQKASEKATKRQSPEAFSGPYRGVAAGSEKVFRPPEPVKGIRHAEVGPSGRELESYARTRAA